MIYRKERKGLLRRSFFLGSASGRNIRKQTGALVTLKFFAYELNEAFIDSFSAKKKLPAPLFDAESFFIVFFCVLH